MPGGSLSHLHPGTCPGAGRLTGRGAAIAGQRPADRARNEPRDLYDLWHLTERGHVALAQVMDAVGRKMVARGQELKNLRGMIREKEPRYRSLWETRLDARVALLPDFDHVFRAVRRALRQVGVT